MATRLTLLQIVQSVALRHGLGNVSVVASSQDETIQQLYGLANETLEELNFRYRWVELVTPLTFQHKGDSDGGALYIGGPVPDVADWRFYQPETLWDLSQRLQLIGPVDDESWQGIINLGISAGRYQFRFYGYKLLIWPIPTVLADVSFKLEYYSSAPVLATDGTTLKDSFSADTDFCRLPSQIVIAGLRWRYKKEKGLPYAEDKDTYELLVEEATAHTGQQRQVRMDTEDRAPGPMIIIPPGSWQV